MANSGSQKQISFVLRQESLKRYYPQNPTQAYHDIRRFMESHGFEHRQSSVYVSLDKLTTLDVVSLTEQLAMALPWLSRCVNEIDVANIGAQHSLKKVLENACTFVVAGLSFSQQKQDGPPMTVTNGMKFGI